MGREIKRVAAGFSPSLDEVWKGYINPHYTAAKCRDCDGSGMSPEAKQFRDQWYGYVAFEPADTGSIPIHVTHPYVVALAKRNYPGSEAIQAIERQRLATMFNGQRMHHITQWEVDALWKEGRLRDFKSKPTVEQVNEWSLHGFGHDGINEWICATEYCNRNGFKTDCTACKGHGDIWPSKQDKKRYDKWKPTNPPAGDWWQLWSTTTEGTPMTPAFATAEELARHCADNMVSTFGDDTADYETWLKFIAGPGWAPSAISVGGMMQSGVAAMVEFINRKYCCRHCEAKKNAQKFLEAYRGDSNGKEG